MTANRIQRCRAKGWRLTDGAVIVDRGTAWGNPFVVGRDGDAAECVSLYSDLLADLLCLTCKATLDEQDAARLHVHRNWRSLRGKHLACWCRFCPAHKDGKPFGLRCDDCAPRHADVLGTLANA